MEISKRVRRACPRIVLFVFPAKIETGWKGKCVQAKVGTLSFKLALLISFGSGTLMYARRMKFISMIRDGLYKREEKPSATKDFRMEISD